MKNETSYWNGDTFETLSLRAWTRFLSEDDEELSEVAHMWHHLAAATASGEVHPADFEHFSELAIKELSGVTRQ